MALPAEVAYGSWLAETESLRQKQIVQARAYYDGEHDVRLTERQKEFLGYNDPDGARFAWPHDPYNPYTPDKKSPRGMYVSLLTLPIGPEGAQLRFRVAGHAPSTGTEQP